jgi:methyl-accepting chemotaxis protein
MAQRRTRLCLPRDYLTRLVVLPTVLFILLFNAVLLTGYSRGVPLFVSLVSSGSAVLIGLLELALMGVVAAFLVLTTHRLAGPMQALEQALAALGQGDLDATLKFRQGDFAHGVAEQFCVSSAALRQRILHLRVLADQLAAVRPGSPEAQQCLLELQSVLRGFRATPATGPLPPRLSEPS